ncbi:hypothetical protein [Microbacterium sp. 77mftsu3.1]|uniref:hypothetical protein n=1 Tax=Microbacterium sp. 77mftsu3.1 TaxID=1761802 RepID=UPI00035F1882|nr:hypothetical protein [Microbacterium sp. 77mftsu3.1]SDH33143.1 hypothetical protein SAMN04488590_3048 [Microbacterium sp. 77mftsu3.1]
MSRKIVCRDCGDRVLETSTISILRSGGGNYRRAGRRYWGQTCADCIELTLCYVRIRNGVELDTGVTESRYDVSSLLHALAALIKYGESDLNEDRWRERYAPAAQEWKTFEQWWPALLNSLEKWATRLPAYAEVQNAIDAARARFGGAA